MKRRRPRLEPLDLSQLHAAVRAARGETPFRLPPEVTMDKESIPGGGLAYVFRHRTMGRLGRLVLQDTPGGQTFIRCEVAGDSADPTTAKRQAVLEPITRELCRRMETGFATTGRQVQLDEVPPRPPSGGEEWVEGQLVMCDHCDVKVAYLIFGEKAVDEASFEDYASKSYATYSKLNLPTWIVAPRSDGPLGESTALVMQVWPVRSAVERLTKEQFDARVTPLCRHC